MTPTPTIGCAGASIRDSQSTTRSLRDCPASVTHELEAAQALERLIADASDRGGLDAVRESADSPFVFAVAYRRCRGKREVAEDIAQEVFFRILRAKPFARLCDTTRFADTFT